MNADKFEHVISVNKENFAFSRFAGQNRVNRFFAWCRFLGGPFQNFRLLGEVIPLSAFPFWVDQIAFCLRPCSPSGFPCCNASE